MVEGDKMAGGVWWATMGSELARLTHSRDEMQRGPHWASMEAGRGVSIKAGTKLTSPRGGSGGSGSSKSNFSSMRKR